MKWQTNYMGCAGEDFNPLVDLDVSIAHREQQQAQPELGKKAVQMLEIDTSDPKQTADNPQATIKATGPSEIQ